MNGQRELFDQLMLKFEQCINNHKKVIVISFDTPKPSNNFIFINSFFSLFFGYNDSQNSSEVIRL